jgi:hypothetical protein
MKWLWPNRIARGKLHVLAGERAVQVCADLCPRGDRDNGWRVATRRHALRAGDVLMLNVEDDPADYDTALGFAQRPLTSPA